MSFLDLVSLYIHNYAIYHSITLLSMYLNGYLKWVYINGLGAQTLSNYQHKTDIKACHIFYVCVTACVTQVYE